MKPATTLKAISAAVAGRVTNATALTRCRKKDFEGIADQADVTGGNNKRSGGTTVVSATHALFNAAPKG